MDWTPEERAAIAEISVDYEINEDQVIRCALRHYQLYFSRTKAGETCIWSGDTQRARDFAGALAETDETVDLASVKTDKQPSTIWQPIESAPRDGTHILVWNATVPMKPPKVAHYFPEGYGWRLSVNYSGEYSEHGMPPTHWRPLPATPHIDRR